MTSVPLPAPPPRPPSFACDGARSAWDHCRPATSDRPFLELDQDKLEPTFVSEIQFDHFTATLRAVMNRASDGALRYGRDADVERLTSDDTLYELRLNDPATLWHGTSRSPGHLFRLYFAQPTCPCCPTKRFLFSVKLAPKPGVAGWPEDQAAHIVDAGQRLRHHLRRDPRIGH